MAITMLSAEELEQRIRDGIPIAGQMAFQVDDLQHNWFANDRRPSNSVHTLFHAVSKCSIIEQSKSQLLHT